MLNIGGRDWELVFNLDAIDQMEKRLKTKLDSKSITETMGDRQKLVALLYVLAEQGEALNGREIDVDERWFARRITLGKLPQVQTEILTAISDGMKMETDEPNEDEEVDVVLDEIKKKETPGA